MKARSNDVSNSQDDLRPVSPLKFENDNFDSDRCYVCGAHDEEDIESTGDGTDNECIEAENDEEDADDTTVEDGMGMIGI